jgi:4-hydroxybenzoate polyprenyltransferase
MDIFLAVLLGALIHGVAFSINNIFDLPWDRKDPNKQHFPLVQEIISPRAANVATGILTIPLCAVLIIIECRHGYDRSLGWLAPILVFAVIMVTGLLYCEYSKRSARAQVFQVLSFGLMPLLFYLIHGGRAMLSPEIVGTTVALMCVMLMADLVGSLKDIEVDPPAASFARALGCRLKAGKLTFGPASWLVGASSLAVFQGIMTVLLLPHVRTLPDYRVIFLITTFWISWMLLWIMQAPQVYDRMRVFRLGAAFAALAYTDVVVVFSALWGMKFLLWMLILPVGWYLTLNITIWNSFTEPRV